MKINDFSSQIRGFMQALKDFKLPQITGMSTLLSYITFSGSNYDYQVHMNASQLQRNFQLTVTPENGEVSACNMKLFYSVDNTDVMSAPVYPTVTAPDAEVSIMPEAPDGASYKWKVTVWNNLPYPTPPARDIYIKLLIEGTDEYSHTLVAI